MQGVDRPCNQGLLRTRSDPKWYKSTMSRSQDNAGLLDSARRIVVKLGTNLVMRDELSIDTGLIESVADQITRLRSSGKEVLVVSSGAVGIGAGRLGLGSVPGGLSQMQACAAIGQADLMSAWRSALSRHGIDVAQLLISQHTFTNRRSYLNLRATLEQLGAFGVVPIINENDPVATDELHDESDVFSDNDVLSALIMSKLDADLLVLMTTVPGLYSGAMAADGTRQIYQDIHEITAEHEHAASGPSPLGRGGMHTKLRAASIAMDCGGMAVIVDGRQPQVLPRLLGGDVLGTLFLPRRTLSSRRRWILHAAQPAGLIRINDGASQALLRRKASLLPVGIIDITGSFQAGDVARVVAEDGSEIARGVVNYGADEARGLLQEQVAGTEQRGRYDPIMTRDDIVLISEQPT